MTPDLPIHPTTGLRALGMTKRGPIWPAIGGSVDEGAPTGREGATPPADPAAQTPAAPAPGSPASEPTDDTDWKAKYEATVAESRKHEGRAKSTKTQLDGVLAALGLNAGEKLDPDKLAADLTASRSETTSLRVENAVLRAAAANGANPDALTDSRSFMTTVAKLDPTSATFDKDVAKAITDAVKAHPGLAATPTMPQASGAEIHGAGAPADIDTLIADAQKRGALGEVIALKQRKYLTPTK
ncbi:hypothetical protein [Tsukamurella sp. NPDC003166]|uniref:hypothetical protein n=1 Tax=Tsukamurella sp. NPDC003166 TaxID=3154444 RepID=UPI00339F5674